MKKYLKIVLAFALILGLTACGNSNKAAEEKPEAPATENTETGTSNEEKAPVAEVSFEEPVLLTSVGQSADVEMVKSIIDRVGLDFTANNLATSADLGDAKTLILAIGGSSKGLGAAGIDADGELARVQELMDAAKENGVKILALHIGGEARRGELSDKFIKPSFEAADYSIVVKGGDSDGFMEGLAADNGIGIEYIESITDTTTAIENAFAK
ncbi:MAG: DUF6305 family protein [Bacillota bacterium]|nr:DUF6305 family protein [Bacillota bacterium]